MKITFLLSHVPGPRFYKKMKKTKEHFFLSVVYRNRKSETFQTFFYDEHIQRYEVIDGNFKAWKIPINLYFVFIKRSINRLKRVDPDIIHCANLDMLLIARIYKMMYNKEVRIAYEIGDLNKRTYNNSKKIIKRLIKHFLVKTEGILTKSVDLLIISSQYFWDVYYNKFISKEKTFLFPNAPERELFKGISSKTDGNTFTIGFIGRVRYSEQLKMLADVVDRINKSKVDVNIKFLIAGVGPESDTISEYVKDMNFVDFYGAYNYDEEIADIYSSVDMVYSVYDAKYQNVKIAIPNRLYEAIVTEKPIIVAKETKLEDFVVNNGIGFAVDSHNPKDLLELLTNIVEDKTMIKNAKKQCELIKDKFFVDHYQEELITQCKSLLSNVDN